MRFLRVLINAIFCIFLVIVIMLAQTLVFDIISLQSPEVDPILPIGSDGTPGESNG